MKAFRLGKSKKNSKGQLRKDGKTISTAVSNASLRNKLKNDKNKSYPTSPYSTLNRSNSTPSSPNVPVSPLYTNFLANGNNTLNRKNSSSPKSLSRNVSGSKNQIVPEFRVGIRLRPMLETEKDDTENNEELVYLFPQNNILCIREPGTDRLPEIDDGPPPPPGTIAPSMGPYISTNPFNYVFSSVNSQQDVYYQSVHPLVEHFHQGKNSLVLAYGQMGSGKTYTIGFQPENYDLENFRPDIISNNLGFVPRAFQETLSYMHLLKSQGRSVSLLVTFIAISCEDIADLLGESITRYRRPPSPGPKMSSPTDKRDPTTQPKTITVHDRGKQGIYLKGAKYERVESMERLAELLYRGTTFRRIVFGPDSENLSHAILSFQLEQDNPKLGKDKTYSKLNFVDLSCTEKIDKVEARMNRMECGVNDKSWLALSKVINLLTANRPKGYIPYRDSKLTQVLQDSLSGESIVLFLSCLSPTACDESKSVLKYMIRSTNIDQRKTDVSPKLLRSILYNLEDMRETPTSPININSNQSSLSRVVNVDNSTNSVNNSLNRRDNFKTSTALVTMLPTPPLTENENISPGGSSNQSLENMNSSRLVSSTSLLFSNPDSSSPMGSFYEEKLKQSLNNNNNGNGNNNTTTTTTTTNNNNGISNNNDSNNNNINSSEKIPRNQLSKRTSSLKGEKGKYPSLKKNTSHTSLHSVPSINSLRSSLVNERKNSNVGMTQMLEEQLKTLNSLSGENSTIESHQELSKGHRKKNSEGKKHMSFHKRVLSFHKNKTMNFDGGNSSKHDESKGEKRKESINSISNPIRNNDYKDMEKMRALKDENMNHHIAFMLEEIKSTIGEKVKQYSIINEENLDPNTNSVYNLDQLVYYLKVLLQNYSKNQDEVKKLTAIINNSNLVNNNSNIFNNNNNGSPLSAVVSDVNNLKFIENIGNSISKPVSSRPSSLELMNIGISTPPPSHPPPPLPTESSPMIQSPNNNNFKNIGSIGSIGSGNVMMTLSPIINPMNIKNSTIPTLNNNNNNNNNIKGTVNSNTPVSTNTNVNKNANINASTNTNANLNTNTSTNTNINTNINKNANDNIRVNNNTPRSSLYNMDITSDLESLDVPSLSLSNDDISNFGRKNSSKDYDLSSLVSKGKSVLKNNSVYNKNPTTMASPNAYTEDMIMEDMDQAELNKYITNLSIRLKNSINEVKEEKDKCDLLRQKEKNLERKLRMRDKELESLHAELDEKINSFNNAVKVLVMQLGMAQESKNKTQEELNSVEYRTMELAKSLETISELMNGERKNTRNAEDKYHRFVSEYEEEIGLLQGEKTQILHEKESLQQQNANLQSKINKLVKTLKKFQVNLIESEKRNYYESTVNMNNLKNENDILKRKLDEISQTKAYIESHYRQLQAEFEKQQSLNSNNINSNYYHQGEGDLAQQIQEYEKELEQLKTQLRETEEAHQTEVFKLLDRLAMAEGKGKVGGSSSNKDGSKSSNRNNNNNSYIVELEKKLEKSYAIQNELKEKLKNSETIIKKQSLENKELEGKCISIKKSLNTLQDTVSTYENHQTKLMNTNYNLSSQLNNGKKGKSSINSRSYSGFRTIMNDIKKMTVTELQDEVVDLRQEIENINKKNWDLKLEVDRYQSANESNRRTIMLLMKRINGEKGNVNGKKDEDASTTLVDVEGDDRRSSTFNNKDPSGIRNSNSSMNSRHESNTTLLNSESYDEDYHKSSLSKLPALSEADDEILIHEASSDEDDTANVSPFLINKSNSTTSSTAVNLSIHAMVNQDEYKVNKTHSISEASSTSDFSMIKVNDEVCIRESTISTDSLKYY
jgi:hypothetical protein